MFSRFFRSRKKNNTASLAKERLQIIVAHERAKDSIPSPDFLPALQRDILEVVRKYLPISDSQVKVAMEKDGDSDIFELNIILNPDDVEEKDQEKNQDIDKDQHKDKNKSKKR